MSKYIGSECPVCNHLLKIDDEIVVCPECGAPYHKECFKEKNKCLFDDLHKENKTFELKYNKKDDFNSKELETLKCTRCGSKNPSNGVFCEICGNPLDSDFAKDAQKSGAQNPYNNLPLNPYVSPFAGIDPEEEINGEKAKDIVVALGQNTPYFIRKFKYFVKFKKGFDFNWAAMFFGAPYFFYRKMWLYGVIAGFIAIFLKIPTIAAYVSIAFTGEINFVSGQNMMLIFTLFDFLSLAFRFCCGLFTNKLYMNHLLSKMKKVRRNLGEDAEKTTIYTAYNKIGSVSLTSVLIIACCSLLFSIGAFFLLYFSYQQGVYNLINYFFY